MRKYNLFDNFLCLMIGGIIAIFVYHQFQLSYHKPQENTENKEQFIIKDLSIQQKKDLISDLKTILFNFNNVN
ncbi:hypothetical protein, partial [Vaccinium witches'-broom phytoplasma]|uniref:hypothetical protein n=1 Tax=Vaccinium witches'-broom phytoplasma TaxID=85642 RepID=UPI000571864E